MGKIVNISKSQAEQKPSIFDLMDEVFGDIQSDVTFLVSVMYAFIYNLHIENGMNEVEAMEDTFENISNYMNKYGVTKEDILHVLNNEESEDETDKD